MAFPSQEPVQISTVSDARRMVLYIVDDEPELLGALTASLGEFGFSPQPFSSPSDLLRQVSSDEIGCVITDLKMPEMGGVELQSQLAERESCLSVILLTAFADVPTAVHAMKLGATTVIEKPFELQSLADEIRNAMRVSEKAFARRARLREARDLLSQLSPEEKAVLQLAVDGTPNRMIASDLGISPRTVDRRRQSALLKLKADSISEYAILKTLVEPE